MARAFYGTNPNLNHAVNRLNRETSGIFDVIGGILGGGGAQASNAKVEECVKWLVNKATSQYITYNPTNSTLKDVNANSFNCASFIITGFYAVGIDINATNCSDMVAGFTAKGWEWIPKNGTILASECRRGDILLDEQTHTQMYIGNNQDVNCGSTPAKVQPHAVDNYGRGWDGILRYKG